VGLDAYCILASQSEKGIVIQQIFKNKQRNLNYIVGGFSPTPLKNMLVKMEIIFPNFRGEHKKSLKPPRI